MPSALEMPAYHQQLQTDSVDIETTGLGYSVRDLVILDDISLRTGSGLSIVGPSGSGKTTLLRCLSGLTEPSSGTVRFVGPSGRHVSRRDIAVGFVFQDLGIFERSNVRQNIYLGDQKRWQGHDADQVVSTLGLDGLLDRDTQWLSGGERQRVAIARALVRKPSILFLDEPFSNIDSTLAIELELLLAQLQFEYAFTMVYVTHNVRSAVRMSPRVAFMDGGRVHQIGPPPDLVANPATRQIMDFFAEFPSIEVTPAWSGTGTGHLVGGPQHFCRADDVHLRPSSVGPETEYICQQVSLLRLIASYPEYRYVVRAVKSEQVFVAKSTVPLAMDAPEVWAVARRDSVVAFDSAGAKSGDAP